MAGRMTLKMLIVDDEPLICQGLATTIPWQEMGIEIAGSAINGKQAMEIIKRESVDIVITDVNMPEMDGIELSRAIVEHFPDVSIIMISGYDEFDYALQALRIGVKDYLLKPVDIDNLIKLVCNVKEDIEEKRIYEQEKEETILTNYLSQQLFFLPDAINLPEQIKNDMYVFRILLVEKRNYDKTNQSTRLYEELKPIMEQSEILSICIDMHENQSILFLYDQEGIPADKLEGLSSAIIEAFHHEVYLAMSSDYNDLRQLATVYQELNKRLSYYRGTEKQIILESEQLPSVREYKLDRQRVRDLMNTIFQQNKEEVEKLVNNLFTDFQQCSLPLHKIKSQCLLLLKSIKENGQSSIPEEMDFTLNEETDLLIFNSHCTLRNLLLDDLNSIMDHLGRTTDSHWIIQQAKRYIEKNYQKDIKAVTIAEAHYITPNYFSMLFKQETGCNYSEYLNTVRINKAKELLSETSNKVFEIAEYVGYREYKYFVQVFKNFTGTTPTQFRKLHFIDK